MYLPHLPCQANEHPSMAVAGLNDMRNGVQREEAPRDEPGRVEDRGEPAEERRTRPRRSAQGQNGRGGDASERGRRPPVLYDPPPRDRGDGPKSAETERDRAAGGNARKGKDRHASIRISLDQHAERVAKKQRTGEGAGADKKTAAQRLAAIRSRVLAKCTNAAEEKSGSEKEEDGRAINAGGAGAWADGKPETGDAHAMDATARRNELLNMHFETGTEGASRIRNVPACETRSKNTLGTRRCKADAEGAHDQIACGGRASMSSDAADAASRVAWHTAESEMTQPR